MNRAQKESSLRAAILHALEREQIADCDAIKVRVNRGQVTLSGFVQTEAQRILALVVTRGLPGVRRVLNMIDVPDAARGHKDHALADRVRAVLAANILLPKGALEVSVLNGIVTLTGTLQWPSQRRAAETDVLCLDDIRGLASHIAVASKAAGRG